MILLAYFMLAFSGIVQGQSNGNTLAEVFSFIIVMVIIISNFFVLFMKTWRIMVLKGKRTIVQREIRNKKRLDTVGKSLKLRLNKIAIEPGK